MTTATVDRPRPDQTDDQPGRLARWSQRRADRKATPAPAAPAPVTPRPPTVGGVSAWAAQVDQRAIELAAQYLADRIEPGQVVGRARALVRRRPRVERTKDQATPGRPIALAVPVILVNLVALSGQIGWAMDHLGTADWLTAIPHGPALRSLMFAAALESIGVYLSYEAHSALLAKIAAVKLRFSAYAVGLVVGAMNYSHYAVGWHPNAAAIGYGLLSMVSPLLWTVRSMARSRKQLIADGTVDRRSAKFSGAKKLLFPLRWIGATRYAVDHGITDERPAWDAYREHRDGRRADRARRRADQVRAVHTSPTPGRVRGWWIRRLGGAVPAAPVDHDRREDQRKPPAPKAPRTRKVQKVQQRGSLTHDQRVAALLQQYPGDIPARRTVQAAMRETGPGWSNAGQVQSAVNAARRQRERAA